ncbi:unnamed protein product [Discosporangium mesarthrocarpum]
MPTSGGGRLVFKGGEAAVSAKGKKKAKAKKRKQREEQERAAVAAAEGVSSTLDAGTDGRVEVEFRPVGGTGRMTSSGTTIHGHEAKFMDELHVGDAVIIKHPTTLRDETRIVKMVLSNVSISVSSPFSSDLISTTSFRYIKAPREEETEESKAEAEKKRKLNEESTAFGTYAGGAGTKLVYRERTAMGNYRIVEVDTEGGKTREELLDMRTTKKADRHCN